MATTTSRPVENRSARIPAGVPPLRAGQGNSFLWRRLHSLSGIFPIGAFLVEHFISNAYATNGVHAYNEQVKFLTSLPFVIAIETIFIYIPILYHALYGLYIWWRGESNALDYPWIGNRMYTLQRWTGIVAFFFIGYHTWTMRFTGGHIIGNPQAAFAKVYLALQGHAVVDAFYFVGILCASWHFAYGIWLFAAKWGITPGVLARKRFMFVCALIFVAFAALGSASLYKFMTPPTHESQKIELQQSLDAYQKALNETR